MLRDSRTENDDVGRGSCQSLAGASARSGIRAAKGAWTVLDNLRLDETRAAAEASIVAAADANAKRLAPILREVEAPGAMSLLQIAAALAARGIPAVTGAGRWSPQASCEPETSLALACSRWRTLSKSASTRPVMGELATRMAIGGHAILSTHCARGRGIQKMGGVEKSFTYRRCR
jgi:hypothetical protein